MAVYQNYLRDRMSKVGVLIVIAIVVQLLFAAFVRPMADEPGGDVAGSLKVDARRPFASAIPFVEFQLHGPMVDGSRPVCIQFHGLAGQIDSEPGHHRSV